MNITQFWTAKVNQAMTGIGIPHCEAWLRTAKTHPDAAILLNAAGKTRQSVQFFNSKLTEIGGQRLTVEDRKQFANAVQDEMKRTGCAYGIAFNRVAATKPQFVNSQADNSKPSLDANGVPVPSPQLKALFRLPVSTTAAEWAAAWAGNGSAFAPIHFGKVFDALCGLAQKDQALDYESALRTTKTRFPDLWAACEELSKLPI